MKMKSKLLCTLFAAAGLTAGCNYDYGDGQFVGNVVKLAKEGTFCKTWEGEMALANLRGARASGSGNTLDFTVQDEAIRKQLDKALNDMSVVHVTYHELGNKTPCAQGTSHIITSVAVMAQGNVSPFNKTAAPHTEATEEGAVFDVPAKGGVRLNCTVAPK